MRDAQKMRDAQFVRWSCGCKGLVIGEHCFVIKFCDSEDAQMTFHERDMLEQRRQVLHKRQSATETEQDFSVFTSEELEALIMKDFEPLPYPEVAQLIADMSRLLADGYGLRQLQSIVGHTWKPFVIQVCAECGMTTTSAHQPSCGKATVECPYVVEDDCKADEE